MTTPELPRKRRRRHSRVRRSFRKHWADYVVTVVLMFACVVALLLIMDVIDQTIGKPGEQTVTTKEKGAVR